MITADFTNSEFIAEWTMAQLGLRLAAPYWAFGFLKDGELRAGVVLNGWNRANVDLTLCSRGMINRATLRATFAYIFDGLGASRVTARALVSNRRMCDMFCRLGFELEGEAPRYYGAGRHGDALVYRMLAENCPWLRGPDGRARAARPQRDSRGPIADEPRNGHHSARPEQHKSAHALWQPDL